MLKRKITKKQFEELDEAIQALYTEKDGAYHLDVEGGEGNGNGDDVAELRRAKEREAQAARDARKELKEMQTRLDELEGDDARKRGDIEAIEKSWKTKYENRENELLEKLSKKDGFIEKSLRENTAKTLASKISTVPSVMSKVLLDRLKVDLDADEPTLRVLDKDGNASALTLDDLEKEVVADTEFAPIIIGSKASGGGAGTDASRGKSGASPKSEKVDVAKLSPQEHLERLQASKEQGA